MAKKRQVTKCGGNGAASRVTRGTLDEVRRNDANGRYDLRPLTKKSWKRRLLQQRRLLRKLQKKLAAPPQPKKAQMVIMLATDEVADSGCGDVGEGEGALSMKAMMVLQGGSSLDASVEVQLKSEMMDCNESVPPSGSAEN